MQQPLIRKPFDLPFDPGRKRDTAGRPTSFVQFVIESTKPDDIVLINRIATRTVDLCKRYGLPAPSQMQMGLDIAIAHARRPMNLWTFLRASDEDFTHDVLGISRHVDRESGHMRDGWTPRHLKA